MDRVLAALRGARGDSPQRSQSGARARLRRRSEVRQLRVAREARPSTAASRDAVERRGRVPLAGAAPPEPVALPRPTPSSGPAATCAPSRPPGRRPSPHPRGALRHAPPCVPRGGSRARGACSRQARRPSLGGDDGMDEQMSGHGQRTVLHWVEGAGRPLDCGREGQPNVRAGSSSLASCARCACAEPAVSPSRRRTRLRARA